MRLAATKERHEWVKLQASAKNEDGRKGQPLSASARVASSGNWENRAWPRWSDEGPRYYTSSRGTLKDTLRWKYIYFMEILSSLPPNSGLTRSADARRNDNVFVTIEYVEKIALLAECLADVAAEIFNVIHSST